MTAWWYTDRGRKRIGPVDQAEIERLIESGEIGPQSLLWKSGMDAWRRFDQIEELLHIKPATPPPLPPEAAIDTPIWLPANRWPRFFARIFDLWIEMMAVSFSLAFVLGRSSPEFLRWLDTPGSTQMFGLLCVPIALTLDAAIHRVFGNTPGKALLGLRVERLDGAPIAFGLYLERNLSLWFFGLAFGLPLINLMTMANQAMRIGRGKPARHDESTGCRVVNEQIGWARRGAFALVFLVALFGMLVISAMEQSAARETARAAVAQDYPWVNPETGRSILIEPRWRQGVQTNPEGGTIYMFTEASERAVVLLAVETFPEVDLDFYTMTLREATAPAMRLADEGSTFNRDGYESWMAKGTMVESPESRVEIQVVKVGDAYWRVIAVQSPPFAYSDAWVETLKARLWRSVL